MAPNEVLGGMVHALGIKVLMHPPRTLPVQRRALQSIENQVAVGTGDRREAGMKLVVDRRCPGDTDVVRQVAVSAEQPAAGRPVTPGIEMHHLPRGVYAAIGATRTGDFNGFVRDAR